MPCLAPLFWRSGFAHVDNVITKRCSKQSHGCSCQGCKATNHTGTLRNLPNPASRTYTSTRRNSPEPSGNCLRNLHQHTPEPSEIFRNLPPELTPAHTGTVRSSRFRNEPTPAHTGTLQNRNLPEPDSGTSSCDPHRHTPELIWAEDPITLLGQKNLWIASVPLNKPTSLRHMIWGIFITNGRYAGYKSTISEHNTTCRKWVFKAES